jgi:hypothetical protein
VMCWAHQQLLPLSTKDQLQSLPSTHK